MDYDSRHLIEQRASQGKGLGIFATAGIPCGVRIIAEEGLFKIKKDAQDALVMIKAFENLPASKQEAYLELHEFACNHFRCDVEGEMEQDWVDIPRLHRKVLAIWATNRFVDDVYLLGSRINHSCAPNCEYQYNPALEKGTFHAIRDIVKGEEVTIMYCDGTNLTRDQRQNALEDWGFKCSCPTCEDTPEGRKKEEKRVELFRLDQELLTFKRLSVQNGSEDAWKRALKTSQSMAALQESEGLVNIELGTSYHYIVRYSLRLGDVNMALIWAEKELEFYKYCIGIDHPDYQTALDKVIQMRSAARAEKCSENPEAIPPVHK